VAGGDRTFFAFVLGQLISSSNEGRPGPSPFTVGSALQKSLSRTFSSLNEDFWVENSRKLNAEAKELNRLKEVVDKSVADMEASLHTDINPSVSGSGLDIPRITDIAGSPSGGPGGAERLITGNRQRQSASTIPFLDRTCYI